MGNEGRALPESEGNQVVPFVLVGRNERRGAREQWPVDQVNAKRFFQGFWAMLQAPNAPCRETT